MFERVKLKVAVGLSGGVDSSVTALVLKNEGYEVTGVHMQCFDYESPGCKGKDDRADAIKVASFLDLKFINLNFEKEYKNTVLKYFFNELKQGRTPNPDVLCNSEIKFGIFLDWALNEGFDFVATGHYAKLQKNEEGEVDLLTPLDKSKDQSYFLYRVPSKKLQKVIFPLGEYKKSEVRKIAKEAKLHVAEKKDSTGICFIGDLNVTDFIKSNIPLKKGDVLDIHGDVVGSHDGVPLYTVGQRHGFKLTKYYGVPVFVISKNAANNTVTIGYGSESQKKEFLVSDLVFLNKQTKDFFLKPNSQNINIDCSIRIRNLGEKMKGSVLLTNGKALVKLTDFAMGIASGQSAVFYDGDKVLGGGFIV